MVAEPESKAPVFTYGRMALWLVLLLIAVSIAYSAWHVIANWNFITV